MVQLERDAALEQAQKEATMARFERKEPEPEERPLREAAGLNEAEVRHPLLGKTRNLRSACLRLNQ